MKLSITEQATGKKMEAEILPISGNERISKRQGWDFDWKQLMKTEGAMFFKLVSQENPAQIEGIIMISLLFDEMVYMNNIEIAPHNRGSSGRYNDVAGCLIAFACRLSLNIGKGEYQGYLSFDSKTRLIELYQNKYGAKLAMGNRMYIDPQQGKHLIKSYLGIKNNI